MTVLINSLHKPFNVFHKLPMHIIRNLYMNSINGKKKSFRFLRKENSRHSVNLEQESESLEILILYMKNLTDSHVKNSNSLNSSSFVKMPSQATFCSSFSPLTQTPLLKWSSNYWITENTNEITNRKFLPNDCVFGWNHSKPASDAQVQNLTMIQNIQRGYQASR